MTFSSVAICSYSWLASLLVRERHPLSAAALSGRKGVVVLLFVVQYQNPTVQIHHNNGYSSVCESSLTLLENLFEGPDQRIREGRASYQRRR